jgi:hypothetical protein
LPNRHEPTPTAIDRDALRASLRTAIAVHTDKLQRLHDAEVVLANSTTHLDSVTNELRLYNDLDERVASAIAGELRTVGKADVPYALAMEQRQRATASERYTHLAKAHALINGEVAQRRAEVSECESQMRAAALAILAAHGQDIAEQVAEAEQVVLVGRGQLVALAHLGPIALSPYMLRILANEPTPPKVNEPITDHGTLAGTVDGIAQRS